MKENNIISTCLFVLMIFSSTCWYIAETDNDILRKELSYYKGEEVRK